MKDYSKLIETTIGHAMFTFKYVLMIVASCVHGANCPSGFSGVMIIPPPIETDVCVNSPAYIAGHWIKMCKVGEIYAAVLCPSGESGTTFVYEFATGFCDEQ